MNSQHSYCFRPSRPRRLQHVVSVFIAQSLLAAVASSSELPESADVSIAGLVAAYSFDEGSGATVNDFSGNGNTGTISGATWTLGKFGNALSFNGSTNWVTVNDSDSLDLSTGMTLEAWVFPTLATGNWTTVLLKEAPPGFNL